MEAKHWGLRKSRNATSLNSRFKSLDTLKVKIISMTFRRVIRTNHKKASKIWSTLPTAYDVYPLDGRHDGGYYTVKDCVTIDVLPRTPGNNVYVGFMVWSNFTATKCRGLVSLNQ